MQFNAETGLGHVWVTLVRAGTYPLSQVPQLGNLPDIVKSALEQEENR